MKKKCDYVINCFKNTDQLNYRENFKTSDLTKCKTTQIWPYSIISRNLCCISEREKIFDLDFIFC